jgi:serine/threonine protein kinase
MSFNIPQKIGNWIISKDIDSGGYPDTYKAVNIHSNLNASVKKIDIDALSHQEGVKPKIIAKRMDKLILKLKNIDHKNIIKVYDGLYMGESYFIIKEYTEAITLSRKIGGKCLKEYKCKKIFRKICKVIYYCHNLDPPIIHQDLNLDNILIDKNNNIKLTDVGLTSYLLSDRLVTMRGSEYFSPPEVFFGVTYLGKPYDIWSLGMILIYMLCGNLPEFSDLYLLFSNHLYCSYELKRLIKRILDKNINLRATIEDILMDPWVLKKKYKKKIIRMIT